MTACQFVLKIFRFYDNPKMKKPMAQRLTNNKS
jgi:hypothetical protein